MDAVRKNARIPAVLVGGPSALGDRADGSEWSFCAQGGGCFGPGDQGGRDVRAARQTAVAAGGLNVAFVAARRAHHSTSCWPPSMSKVPACIAIMDFRGPWGVD